LLAGTTEPLLSHSIFLTEPSAFKVPSVVLAMYIFPLSAVVSVFPVLKYEYALVYPPNIFISLSILKVFPNGISIAASVGL
jgi:hypothetical protein